MKRADLYIVYKNLRDQGKNYHEIARFLGVDPHWVGKYCRKHGLGYSQEELDRQYEQVSDSAWDLKVKAHFGNNFEVVKSMRPGEGGERDIIIRCTDCGTMSIISSITLRKSRQNKGCANCRRIRKEEEKIEKQIEKQELKLKQMIARRHERSYQAEFPTCKCGALIPMRHKVCEDCKKETRREENRRRETIRRQRCTGGDWSINLKELFQRDDGVCHICGKPCDWEDYREESGAFIAGDDYPSIDHVIPLSRGGVHEWSNVRLAHFICNSIKADSIAAPVKND